MESDVAKDGDVPSCPDLLGCAHSPRPVMIASSESGIITRVCHHVQGLHNGPMPIIAIRSATGGNQNSQRRNGICGERKRRGKRRLGDNAEAMSTGIKRGITAYQFGMDRGSREASPAGW